MSEWVDFCLYSLQAVLLWIALPAWGTRVLRPIATGGARSLPAAGWISLLRAWGLLSVLALLAYRLQKMPAPFSAAALHKAGWEALLMTSNLLLALGLLIAAYGLLRFVRWLKGNADATEERPHEVFALTRDDFLPRRMQYLAYALMLLALVARPVAGWIWPDRVQGVWGNFFTGILLAALLFFAAAGSVMRAPNQLDRVLGPRYRQLEVGACFLLMGCLALLEIGGLALELSGEMSRRHVALLVAAFISLTLGGLMLLSSRPARTPATPGFDLPQ